MEISPPQWLSEGLYELHSVTQIVETRLTSFGGTFWGAVGLEGSPLYGRAIHFALGVMLKMVDDLLDDGVWRWLPGMHALFLLFGCVFMFSEMTRDGRVAVMMTAFTVNSWETGGLDNKTFVLAAGSVFVAYAVAMALPDNHWMLSDFHMHMCLLGTTYAGIITTRLNDQVERLGRVVKAVFRLTVGLMVAYCRVFIPQDYLVQHDFLANFTLGYFFGTVLSSPEMIVKWWTPVQTKEVRNKKRK